MPGKKQLIVIGGGAAGFFCAVNAARLNPELNVKIAEKTGKILSKVRVSGGGRCNLTHSCFDIAEMSRNYPRGGNFLKKAFHYFFTSDTISWFESRGVKTKTEADGRMFPASNTSGSVIDCLRKEATKYGVEILLHADVKQIECKAGGLFRLKMATGADLEADFVCVACGGFPKTSMFGWLTSLGHSIEEPAPSLFTFNMPGNNITQLRGVSVEQANVKIIGSRLEEKGPVLITHWGLSGPAVLRLSAWGARQLAATNYRFLILVNWLPAYNENTLRERIVSLRFELASQKIKTRSPLLLPQRLWEFLLGQSGIGEDTRWADLGSKAQNKLIKNLCAWEAVVNGKTTFKEEFVTAGGIRLNEVDVNTMMSKKVDRLYFAGEIIDADGITGGFNFQHAWTTGFIAAQSIAASVNILEKR